MALVEEMELVQEEEVWVDQEETEVVVVQVVEEEVVVVSEDLEMAVQDRIQGLVVAEEVEDKLTDTIIKCKYLLSNCSYSFTVQISIK